MAQFLWRRKRCSKIPLGMVQMQPSHGSLLTDNQMVSRDTQERQNEAPCHWAGRRLLAKDRLCNKMGNQVKLENILDDIKTAGKQSKKHLTRPKNLEMLEAMAAYPWGTTEPFTMTHIA